jgi:hypothetical protein
VYFRKPQPTPGGRQIRQIVAVPTFDLFFFDALTFFSLRFFWGFSTELLSLHTQETSSDFFPQEHFGFSFFFNFFLKNFYLTTAMSQLNLNTRQKVGKY